jgi:hypothetical protein
MYHYIYFVLTIIEFEIELINFKWIIDISYNKNIDQ